GSTGPLAPGRCTALESAAAGPAMSETFSTTPRAPRRAQLGAIALGIVATALAMRTTAPSSAWVNRVFAGFLLLDNRVVASVALGHWSGAEVDGLFQSQVVAVQGKPVTTTPEIYERVAAMPPGTPVRYTLREGGAERDVVVATERFAPRDWFLLFGA